MSRHRAAGFTIVELLAATLLTALFMAAAVSIVASLGRTRTSLAARDLAAPAPVDPVEIIRWDLANARAASTDGKRTTILGYACYDFKTTTASHRPVEITYELRNDGKRNWLIRRQRDIGSLTNIAIQSQPIAAGIAEFRLDVAQPVRVRTVKRRTAQPAPTSPGSSVTAPPPPVREPYVAPVDPLLAAGVMPLPPRVTLTLIYSDGRPRRDETFFTRAEVLE